MHENLEQLSETFKAHEHLTPNIEEVLEKANLRARTYRRRRRAAQATGASVLGAGIVASGVILPGQHWGSTSRVATADAGGIALPVVSGGAVVHGPAPVGTPSLTVPSPHATRTPASVTEDQEMSAYFAAGYDYDNAVALSKLWNETDIAKVKAAAGLKLLQGETLPVTPNGTPETPQEKEQEQAQDAFFSAGYDYYDALALGTLWHETDLSQIKTEAGQKLLDGGTLPIGPGTGDTSAQASDALPLPPNGSTANGSTAAADAPDPSYQPSETAQDPALGAYFAAGYGYDDAVALGKLWHETDLLQIKIDAGKKLLSGQTLPIAP